MPLENENIQEKEDLRSIQNRGWQDGGGASNPSSNNGIITPPNDSPPSKENIPQLTEEQRSKQNTWRNSSQMQEGLLNILPKGNKNKAAQQSKPLDIEAVRQDWENKNNQQSDSSSNSSVLAFYADIQKMPETELTAKIQAGIGNLTLAANTGKATAAMVSGLSVGNSAATTSKAVTGSVASGIVALKDGVMAVKNIYEAYKKATSPGGSTTQEKGEAALKIVQGLISSASGTVASLKSILDLFQLGSTGLATAIPGLGLALNAVNIAIEVYELMKAKTNESFIRKELKDNYWEGVIGGKKKDKDKRKAQDKYIATFEKEIKKMTKKEKELVKDKSKYEKNPSKAQKLEQTNKKLDGIQSSMTLAKQQLTSLKENQALTNLAQVNKDRQKDSSFNIGVELTSLVGNVLGLVPEPSAQIAGVTLKAVATGAVVFKKIGGVIVQKMRDHADKNPKSILNGMVDSSRSTTRENNRKQESARYIINKIAKMDLEDSRSVDAINQYIQAAGMSPSSLAQIYKEKGVDKAVEALIKAQG